MAFRGRVLLTDLPWGDSKIERSILEPAGIEVVEAGDDSESALVELAGEVDAIATCWAKVTGRVIAAAPRCRHIARMGIGLDNIDLDAAESRDIVVTNVPDYCVTEVADHTMAMLLAAARNIAFYDARIKRGEYELTAGRAMFRLEGRVLGLVGFGRIARDVFSRAKAFGLDVQATSRSGDDYGTGCRMTSLGELLTTSDFISLHAPLTPETRHLLNAESLQRLKPSAVVINTSRGGLIDQEALWEAVRSNQIAGAALDVFEQEPPDVSHPLFADERVIVTPHAAFVSEDSLTELRQRVAQQILDVFDGREPESLIRGSE